jgi:hypothetical protein
MTGIPKDPKYWYVISFRCNNMYGQRRTHKMDVLANDIEQAESLAKSCATSVMKWYSTVCQGTKEEYEEMLERRPFG